MDKRYAIIFPLLLFFCSIAEARPAPEMVTLETGSELATWTISPDNPSHATPILFLHGGPGMYTEERRIEEGGVFRKEGFQTIYFDQAGGGLSKNISPTQYTIDRALADIEALRIALGKEQLILWGNSYGASLATVYANRFPERVAGLIFTSPGQFPGTKGKRNYKITNRGKIKPGKALKQAARIIDKKGAAAEAGLSQSAAGRIFDTYVSTQLMGGMLCKGSQFEHQMPIKGGNLYANRLIQNSLADLKFVPDGLPKVPAILVRGSCDFHSLSNAESYREAFGSKLIEIPGSGHGLLDNREAVDNALSNFAKVDLALID